MKKVNYLILFVLSLVFLQCFSKKDTTGDTLGLYFILKERNSSNDTKEVEKFSINFSGINESLQDVLAYKSKEDTTSSRINLALSDEAKQNGWQAIPSSKKVEIEKDKKIDLSLGGVVSLGEQKITSNATLTLVSVMGSEDKVKNFKYLALSLSSKKTGTLTITAEDFKDLSTKLVSKKIDFSKPYTEFKADSVITTVLTGKTPATDSQVNDYKTNKKVTPTPTPTPKPTGPKKIILWSYADAKKGGGIGGETQAHALCADATKHPQSVKDENLTTHKAFLVSQSMGTALPFWPFPKSFTGANDKIPDSNTRPLYGEDGTTKVANNYNEYFDLSKNALSSLNDAGTTKGTNAANEQFLFSMTVVRDDFTMGQGSCGTTGGRFWNNTGGSSAFGGLLSEVDKQRFYETTSSNCNTLMTLLCVSY